MPTEEIPTEGGHKRFPIQLNWVGVKELSIKAQRRGGPSVKVGEGSFSMTDGHSEYDSEKKTIQLVLRGEIGKEDFSDNVPFHLIAEIVGEFSVDETRFPLDKLDPWASRIAPMVLYPYLRENVYSLTQRCGFSAVILPLFEVPTLRQAELQSSQESIASEAIAAISRTPTKALEIS